MIEEFIDHKSETNDIKLLETITFNKKVNAVSRRLHERECKCADIE